MNRPSAAIGHRWLATLLPIALAGCVATTPPVDPHDAARAALDEGRLTHVISHLQPLASKGEASVEEMHMLSDAYMRRGDGAAALATLEAARPLERPGSEGTTLRKMGEAAALAGKYAIAITHLRRANVHEPQAATLRLLTRLLIDSDDIPAAIETGQAAIRMELTHPDGFVLLGTAFALEGIESQALTAVRRAEALGADGPETLVALGNIHLAFDRLEDAIKRYEGAVKRAPNHVEAHQKLGLAKTLQGDAAGAIQALQRARSLAPDNVEILNNLGVALSELRLHGEAAKAYAEAHRLAPDATVLAFNHADALALDGRPLEAHALLQATSFPLEQQERAASLATRMEAIHQASKAACATPPSDASPTPSARQSSLDDRILKAAIARCR